MAGALEGLRVVDFGQYIAGPMTAMLLADQGAAVTRVDPPGGPLWDTPANATWNRGKRSIVLDLKQEAGREIARRLVAAADVVVENFRPGVMDRLGLGAEAMTAANPRLIYCSLPGFASDDPRAGTAAWEGVVGAAAAYYRHDRAVDTPGAPIYSALPLASSYAAIQAAVAIAMALGVRHRDGVGQQVTVPLFDAMFGAVGYNGLRIHDSAPQPLRGMGAGFGGQHECADGRWVMFMAGNSRPSSAAFARLIEATGIGSWEAEGLFDRERVAREPELAAELKRRVDELFKQWTAAEWERMVAEAGVECAVCRPSAEWLTDPHARESETIVEVEDPRYGTMLQPGVPARLSLTPGAVQGPAPRLDAGRDAVLAELSEREPAATDGASGAALKAALDGVRVIDLCIVLAGPTLGRTLAEYGADVIKIEAPDRPPGSNFHYDINRGKRHIVVDLKSPEGLEVFWKLVEDADVVTQNFRMGVAERLGIGYDDVRSRRPDIVYASLDTYGRTGSSAGRPGHEQIAQAATGMQARFGGDGPPQLQRYAVNDYGTGYLGAYAVALALLHRRRTGEGQHVTAALAYTATTLQTLFMQGYEGKTWDEARGQSALGQGTLHRAYEASDGWLFIGARRSDVPRLASVEGMSGVERLAGEELEAELERRFPSAPVAGWVARLTAAGIGAHRVVNSTRDLMDDPWVQAHGLSVTREHEGMGMITTVGPAPRLSRTPVQPGRPASLLGSDGREILAEAGLGDRIESLLESGAVVEAITAR